jgi:hypothetical protein
VGSALVMLGYAAERAGGVSPCNAGAAAAAANADADADAAASHLSAGGCRCVTHFDRFFRQKEPRKRLCWCHTSGSAQLEAHLAPQPRERKGLGLELRCSTVQAILLLAFNTAEQLTLSQFVSLVGIPRPLLVEQLLTLTSPLHPILRSSRPVAPPSLPCPFRRDFTAAATVRRQSLAALPPKPVRCLAGQCGVDRPGAHRPDL